MTGNEPRKPRFSVGHPVKRGKLVFEPTVPPDGPVTGGPLIHVRHPLVRGTLTFEPVVTTELELPAGADGERMFGTLTGLIEKLNEWESLFDRPGVRVNGERSGVRDGKVTIVLTPNDPADAVEACKRVADQLFAAVRTLPGVTVKVLSADRPENPLYELAA